MRRLLLYLRAGERESERLVVEREGWRVRVICGDRADALEAVRLPDGRLSLLLEDGRQVCGRGLDRGSEGADAVRRGRLVRVPITRRPPTRRERARDAEPGGVEEVRALMHGRIVEVRVASGDTVEEGELLLVLEAMKMQNEIRAARAGGIERVAVSPGQTVEGGEFLLSVRSGSN
jgi:biotin carboxyl carrier protein